MAREGRWRIIDLIRSRRTLWRFAALRGMLALGAVLLGGMAVALAINVFYVAIPLDRVVTLFAVNLLVLAAAAQMERTVILSTHIASDIGAACPSVAVLHQGRVIYSGSTGGLAAQADGRLWETTMPVAATETQWPVSHLTTTSQGTVLRVVAPASRDMGGDITGWQAVTETPSVEEGYLALMGKAVPVL